MRYNENILTDSNNRFLLKSYHSIAHERTNQLRSHHHGECELSAIISGNGIYKVKDKTYDFKTGDVFLFAGDEQHCITDIFSKCEILNIHFVPKLLWTDNDLSLSRIFFARSSAYENKIDVLNPHTTEIFNNIISISDELKKKRDGYKSMVKYLLLSSITSIVRHYGYIDNSVSYKTYTDKIKSVEAALSYIDENLGQELSLNEISKIAAMTPTYFSTIFKKLNGISLWEYIMAKRVDMAIELIKTTDMTKLDIAMKCGFNSSSNFYKAFHCVTGKKPGDFK